MSGTGPPSIVVDAIRLYSTFFFPTSGLWKMGWYAASSRAALCLCCISTTLGSIPMWSLGGTSLETVLQYWPLMFQRFNQKFMEHCRHETGDEIPCFVVTMNNFQSPLITIKHYCFHMCSISWRFESLHDKQGAYQTSLSSRRCVAYLQTRTG